MSVSKTRSSGFDLGPLRGVGDTSPLPSPRRTSLGVVVDLDADALRLALDALVAIT